MRLLIALLLTWLVFHSVWAEIGLFAVWLVYSILDM